MISTQDNGKTSDSQVKSGKDSEVGQQKSQRPEEFTLISMSLVKQLGNKAALFIAYLHDLLDNPDFGHFHDGRKWICITYEGWCEQLCWKPRTCQKVVRKLKDLEVLIVRKENSVDRTNHYTLDYQKLAQVYQWTPATPAEVAAYLAYEEVV